MAFSDYSNKERIKAFYSLWFDVKPYIFSDGIKWQSMSFHTTNDWSSFENYMHNVLSAGLCMSGITMHDIVSVSAIKWCRDNQDQILVVYCGEEFNLEMQYNTERHEFLFRSFNYMGDDDV